MIRLKRLRGTKRRPPPTGDLAISVVVPLYNHAAYIAQTLDSVLEQTAAASEIIVIDDGSRDDSYAIAKQKLEKRPNCRVIRQSNAGADQTINRAISLAASPIIAVLNSDDLFMPKKLARCREIFAEKPETKLIVGNVDLIDAAGKPISDEDILWWQERARDFYTQTGLRKLSLLNENYATTTSNMVFTRDLWLGIGGFQPLRYCHDLDFILTALSFAEVHVDDEKHIGYRVHANNTIKESWKRVQIEIGAVCARHMFNAGGSLYSPDLDAEDIAAYASFAQNKNLDRLICFFLTITGRYASRGEFYRYATEGRMFEALAKLLPSEESAESVENRDAQASPTLSSNPKAPSH